MLRDALEYLANLGRESDAIRVHMDPDRFPRTAFMHGPGDSEIRELEIPPPLVNASVLSVESLAQLGTADSAVFAGLDRTVLLLDKGDRRERVTLEHAIHPSWKVMQSRRSDGWSLSPKAAVALLRDVLLAPTEVVTPFRTLDFAVTSRSSADYQHGRESIGRSVEAEVGQRLTIPEYLTLDLPMFTTAGLETILARYVVLAVDPEPTEGLVHFRPRAGEVDRANTDALESIGDAVSGALATAGLGSVPVVLGSPDPA